MAITDSNGIVFLEETDPISPFHTTINALQQGTSDAFSTIKDGSDGEIILHYVASTAARGALATAYGPTASKPLYVYRGDATVGEELEVTEDGVTWNIIPKTTTWASYTPALTASVTNPVLGSGAGFLRDGRYTKVGKTVQGWFTVQFGATGMSVGSGTYSVSLPTAMAAADLTPNIGNAWIFLGGVWYPAIMIRQTATTVQFRTTGATPTVAHNVPGAWSSGNGIRGTFEYEAA